MTNSPLSRVEIDAVCVHVFLANWGKKGPSPCPPSLSGEGDRGAVQPHRSIFFSRQSFADDCFKCNKTTRKLKFPLAIASGNGYTIFYYCPLRGFCGSPFLPFPAFPEANAVFMSFRIRIMTDCREHCKRVVSAFPQRNFSATLSFTRIFAAFEDFANAPISTLSA